MTPAAEKLVLAHLPLVHRIAARVAKRVPYWIEMEELVANGNVGLCQAAKRYRRKLHPNFAVYASKRIYGSMIDPYRGRNYPRLTTSMPEDWLNDGERRGTLDRRNRNEVTILPPQLVDPSPSAEEVLIEQEESLLLTVEIVNARRGLTLVEGRALDRSVSGESMRAIGIKEKRSGAWAHYVIHRGKKKLRDALSKEKKAA